MEKKNHSLLSPLPSALYLRSSFFSSEILIALVLSCSLHLSFFLFFSFNKIDTGPTTVHLPLLVSSNVEEESSAIGDTFLTADNHDLLPRFIDEPESHLSLSSNLPSTVIDKDFTQEKLQPIALHTFSQIERRQMPKLSENLEFNFLSKLPLLDISTSGEISSYEMNTYNISEHLIRKNLPEAKGRFFISFEVQLESKTGEIFWYQISSPSKNSEIDEIAKQVIQSLRFSSQRDFSLPKGKIELIFNFS
jgi:hypothetical protein